ncbi:probable DNA metabolism protein [Flavobacteriaceae bacterium MAR_2010_188]|nr:probable DNA metabolism protein [Flavobacteriaceae bacterium MAR_2010_188]
MLKGANFIYDGSFEGFLSCIFHAYELKSTIVNIQSEKFSQTTLFTDAEFVKTDSKKSDRIFNHIIKKSSAAIARTFYFAFLTEQENIENLLYRYIRYVFDSSMDVSKDYSSPEVLKVAQLAKNVGREKHRMEAFIRFRLTKDEIYFAVIEPDYNVVPVIVKHFKSRYADQKWLIYDTKRDYGIYYDLTSVEFIQLDFNESRIDPRKTSEERFAESEMDFQKLWFEYFRSTNIKARINMKLHIRHVPKRYWKYLSEKNPY